MYDRLLVCATFELQATAQAHEAVPSCSMLFCCPRSFAHTSVGRLRTAMSLADLWTAHSVRRSTQLTVSTDASAHNKQSSSSYTASASRQAKRKRLAESIQTREVPKVQLETARKPVRSFAPGETDLGSGSVIIVKPKVFRHDDSQELYKSLKVFSSEFAFDISGVRNIEQPFQNFGITCDVVCLAPGGSFMAA